ncbi:hypothetical protein [Spirillospora sp. CA-294931]|uniref:hypothetical protein n=1 Tax=Spirillospora sp. CA-294931 TaxID=3240042 RepID=UPI003D8B3D31
MAAVVLAALILLVPPRMSSGTKTAFCELFGGKNCDKQSSSSPAAGNPSSGPSGGPPSLPGTPEQAAYDKAKRDADTANTEASNAEKEFEGLKDELWSFLKDLIGITEAEKCIKDFDIMACIETAANAIPWGKAFKLLRKLPKAFKLAGRFKNIWDKVSAARKKRDDAQRALKKAEDDLRKKKEADRQNQAGGKKDPKGCPVPQRPRAFGPTRVPPGGVTNAASGRFTGTVVLVATTRAREDAPTPKVDSERLQRTVNALYHGVGNPNQIGDGSAMAAANHEALGGPNVEGKSHITSTTQLKASLEKFLRENETRLKGGRKVPNVKSARDIEVAKSLIQAIDDALAGKYKGFKEYGGLGC